MNGMIHIGDKTICGDRMVLGPLIMKLNGASVARKGDKVPRLPLVGTVIRAVVHCYFLYSGCYRE